MPEAKSVIETWSQIAAMPENRDGVTGHLPLILSAAGALGVLPFAIIRWLSGDWLIASIDTIIVGGFVFLGTYVYRTRRVRVASIAIALLSVAGTLMSVYLRGTQQVFWAFPALMASFYLLKPREAVALTLTMTALILPQLIRTMDAFLAGTIAITIIVTTAFAYAFSEINSRQQQQLMLLATRDPLTGAGNRRALEQKIAEVIATHLRSGLPASLMLIDLDHFKKINDHHGHAVGDQILRRLTEILNLRLRINDGLFRIGGEEFVVIAENKDRIGAARLAEQLRTLVEVNELVPDSTVTISLGVAEISANESIEDWLGRADAALYEAKRAGRNTIRFAS